MSLFVCAKCGCVDNTATSSYWMLTNEYMVDKFKYAKELQPYKGMGLCSECGRLATSPDGRDVVVPGKINGKKYAGEIWATSWEEAECFIKQRASTEKAVGFIPKD